MQPDEGLLWALKSGRAPDMQALIHTVASRRACIGASCVCPEERPAQGVWERRPAFTQVTKDASSFTQGAISYEEPERRLLVLA